MSEINARIGQSGNIELVDESMVEITGMSPMTTAELAFLGRSLLSCAALLALDKSAQVGLLCADLHFPALKWVVSVQTGTRIPVLIFSIPPGIDLTFQMSPQFEKELGMALSLMLRGINPLGCGLIGSIEPKWFGRNIGADA